MGEAIAEGTEPVDIDECLQYPVKAIKQDLSWDCGPTALRIALKYQFGLKLTGREIIMLCGATPAGSDEYNLMMGLDALGFRYKQSNNGSFNKLKHILMDGQVPIVHILLNTGEGHYMVVSGYDSENVFLADPATNKTLKYGITYFMGIWKEEEKETQTRWYMAITGKAEPHIDSIIKRLKVIKKKLEKGS